MLVFDYMDIFDKWDTSIKEGVEHVGLRRGQGPGREEARVRGVSEGPVREGLLQVHALQLRRHGAGTIDTQQAEDVRPDDGDIEPRQDTDGELAVGDTRDGGDLLRAVPEQGHSDGEAEGGGDDVVWRPERRRVRGGGRAGRRLREVPVHRPEEVVHGDGLRQPVPDDDAAVQHRAGVVQGDKDIGDRVAAQRGEVRPLA